MFKGMREAFFFALANFLPNTGWFERKRFWLFKWAGVRVDEDVIIRGPIEISPRSARNLSVGRGSFINTGCRFSCPDEPITIGKFVKIGSRVCFETVEHEKKPTPNHRRDAFSRPIAVEDQVWIGTGVLVLSGVRIEYGAVVGAGAVVTKPVPRLTIVAGCLAKAVGTIE